VREPSTASEAEVGSHSSIDPMGIDPAEIN